MNETLFIYFEKDDSHQLMSQNSGDSNYFIAKYQFILHNLKDYPQLNESLLFSYRKFRNFDEMNDNNPIIKFKINKKFLKNNADIIIDLKDMQAMGFDKTMVLVKNAKHIFLIDETETKNGQITIKEVYLSIVGRE